MASLYNLDYEASSLAILLKNPEVYAEIDFLTSRDYSKVNSPVFSVIVNLIENKSRPEPLIVAERLKALGISIDGISGFDYVSSLALRPVDKRSIMDIAKELKKKTLIRTICNNADSLKKEVLESENKSGREIIGLADKYLGESLVSLTDVDRPEPVNVFEVMPEIIEEYGNKEDNSNDLIMPHESFRGAFGNLKQKNIYMIIARSGGNKSTFLLDLCRQLPAVNPNKEELKILYLDSEMQINDLVLRYVAGKIGVPYSLIDNREWRFDERWCKTIRQEMDRVRSMRNKNLFFEAVGNKTVSELEKYVKRFYLNNVGRGNPFFIAYDYLKVTEADKKNNSKEHEVAYDKSQCLKELSDYCSCPLFSALQANRSGITTNKAASQIDDSENVASMSDRLSWLAAWMGILRRRTHDELMLDSTPDMKASSHKLIDTKTRYFGKNGTSYSDFIKVKEGKNYVYKRNFINLDINNFSVSDHGIYSDWLTRAGRVAAKLPPKSEEGFI